MATVVVPAVLVAARGTEVGWELGGVAAALPIVAGTALIALGLALFAATVRLFATVGRGTLAPWDPPERLVVRGPYRHLRHPMISGVALVLAGEASLLGSTAIAIWLGAFIVVNAVYLPLVEEPALVRRFGADYERYMEAVPRWFPRLRGWDPPPAGPPDLPT
jgi:protein-S-isoprenylcysteine O-methyltransferase Ste14